ncbi:MAG: hypothetical protein S4CHLAM20_01300 [Chlamydiia bacterium]|nr:hypothetical protein [Chlamydiia bacterium]
MVKLGLKKRIRVRTLNQVRMKRKYIYCLLGAILALNSIECSNVLQEGTIRVGNKRALINMNTIALYRKTAYSKSHGCSRRNLGAGILYYSIPHMLEARLCVCLGSGGGFVPMLMKQAQRDLNLVDSMTVLVDGTTGTYGYPDWLDKGSKFRKNYPDIQLIIDLTANVAKEKKDEWKIDYLHIDADHSLEGCLADFWDYLPMMNPKGVITIHDTGVKQFRLGCRFAVKELRERGYNVVNFYDIGAGLSLIMLGDNNEILE